MRLIHSARLDRIRPVIVLTREESGRTYAGESRHIPVDDLGRQIDRLLPAQEPLLAAVVAALDLDLDERRWKTSPAVLLRTSSQLRT